MTAPFLIRGDALPALANLPDATHGEHPRGMLWGVDLTKCVSRRQARVAWQNALSLLKDELDTAPAVRCVCIACLRPKGFTQQTLIRIPGGLATQLHNDLERDRARYMNTLVLDVTDCDDPDLLRARLGDALTEPTKWSELTLDWNDIAECTVQEAWAREAL